MLPREEINLFKIEKQEGSVGGQDIHLENQ